MRRPPKKYWMLAAAALAVALAAARGGREGQATAVVEPAAKTKPPAGQGVRPDGSEAIRLDKLNRPIAEAEAVNLFAAKSWYVPPPPQPKPALPPRPSAPPLPFTYLGRLQESPGHMVVFLVKGGRVYPVSAGDVIDGIYHVDEVAGDRLALTYLPLNIRQSLSIGETS